MLGTEPVKPFSAMVLWELLGELGPEPGALLHALLHAEDGTTGEAAVTWACSEAPLLPDLHPQGGRRGGLTPRPCARDFNRSLLKGTDNSAILSTQEGTASPLRHLLF